MGLGVIGIGTAATLAATFALAQQLVFFCCKVDYFSFNSKFPAECVILPWQVKWALITWFGSKSLSWPSTKSPSIERQQKEKNYKINKQNKHKKVFLARHNVTSRLTLNRHKTSNEANKQINKQNKHRKSALTLHNVTLFREAAKIVGDAEHSVISGLWTAGTLFS